MKVTNANLNVFESSLENRPGEVLLNVTDFHQAVNGTEHGIYMTPKQAQELAIRLIKAAPKALQMKPKTCECCGQELP